MAMVPSLFTPGSLFGSGADPFLTLHREMNRLFDDVLRGTPGNAGQGGRTGLLMAPNIDVTETDNELRIKAELPGVSENDIDVSLNDDLLTLRAEKKQERKDEREGVHVTERSFGTFQRSLRLPFHVNPDQVQAKFENGVLSITLPKTAPQERSRRIQVQGSQSGQGQSGQRLSGGQSPAAQAANAAQGGGNPGGGRPGGGNPAQAGVGLAGPDGTAPGPAGPT